jgi:hypothetical protein
MARAILLVLLHCFPVLLPAQESSLGILPRLVSVTAGVGNAMGWFGAQGLTFAGGLRGFTRGDKGFTFMASVGLGYAPGVPRRVDRWAGLLGLAAGYTWRRMSQRDLRPMR